MHSTKSSKFQRKLHLSFNFDHQQRWLVLEQYDGLYASSISNCKYVQGLHDKQRRCEKVSQLIQARVISWTEVVEKKNKFRFYFNGNLVALIAFNRCEHHMLQHSQYSHEIWSNTLICNTEPLPTITAITHSDCS